MSILEIELTPELEQRLREKAKRHGLESKPLAQTVMLLALQEEDVPKRPKRSIMELEGLGAEMWKDENGALIDAQDYVNGLRQEWNHRP